MKKEFWYERWEQGQIAFHQEEVNCHLKDFWPKLGLNKGAKVFVPLAGKSRDIFWLLSQGFEVIAIELSAKAVEAFFSENNLNPTRGNKGKLKSWTCEGLIFYEGDFFDLALEELKGVAAIYDRASLIALPPEMRQAYAKHLLAIIPKGAKSLLLTLDYNQSEMPGPPFAVASSEVEKAFVTLNPQALFELDITAENPKFAQAGVTRLMERVYLLS